MAFRKWLLRLAWSAVLAFITFDTLGSWLQPTAKDSPLSSRGTLFSSYAYFNIAHPETPGSWPYRVYKSSPFKPPFLDITEYGGEVAKGFLFMVPKADPNIWIAQDLPVIMSLGNDLVFSFPRSQDVNGTFNNLQPQSVNGSMYLSVWHGTSGLGHSYGELIIMDSEYKQSRVVLDAIITPSITEAIPGTIDFHEQQMTERGTVLVTAYNMTERDLTVLGGSSKGYVADSLFFEIDVQTSEVVFSWSALDHFDYTKSKLPFPSYLSDGTRELGYDFFHINSVQAVGDAYLVSGRHTWGCYLISRETGKVLWGIDGAREDPSLSWPGIDAQFSWQHHARAHNVSETGFLLSLFDNHNVRFDSGTVSSRGLLFNVSLIPNITAVPVLLQSLKPPEDMFCDAQGNYELALSNGNQLIACGSAPIIREYGPSGNSSDIRLEVRFGHDGYARSYRAYKSKWKATPTAWGPSLVVDCDESGQVNLHVSWNGATEVTHWSVYVVGRTITLTRIGQAAAYGFETVIEVPEDIVQIGECIIVAAVQDGQEVRHSEQACLTAPET